MLRRALRAGYRPRSYLVDAKRVGQIADLPDDAPVYAATPDVLETGHRLPRAPRRARARSTGRRCRRGRGARRAPRRVAILEDVNNHTNIGAVFRGAAALGIDAVLLSPTCADPLYRRSVRVSMGEVFAVPYARLEPWPDGLAPGPRRPASPCWP